MGFDVDSWKSQIKDSLPASQYELIVNPPGGGGEEILIRTETASMPGVGFLSVDNFSPYGNGLIYNVPYRYNPQEVQMMHTVDENANIYAAYREWANQIVDLDGADKYGAKFLMDYAVEWGDQQQGDLSKRHFKIQEQYSLYYKKLYKKLLQMGRGY